MQSFTFKHSCQHKKEEARPGSDTLLFTKILIPLMWSMECFDLCELFPSPDQFFLSTQYIQKFLWKTVWSKRGWAYSRGEPIIEGPVCLMLLTSLLQLLFYIHETNIVNPLAVIPPDPRISSCSRSGQCLAIHSKSLSLIFLYNDNNTDYVIKV